MRWKPQKHVKEGQQRMQQVKVEASGLDVMGKRAHLSMTRDMMTQVQRECTPGMKEGRVEVSLRCVCAPPP